MMTTVKIRAVVRIPDVHLMSGIDSTQWLVAAAVRSALRQNQAAIALNEDTSVVTTVQSDHIEAIVSVFTRAMSVTPDGPIEEALGES